MRKNLHMCRPQPRHNRCILLTLAAILAVSALGSDRAAAQTNTQIIDATGDGAGNTLNTPRSIAVDVAGIVYVTGSVNAFKIIPGGVITQIIDATGDGAGNGLNIPISIAVDAAGSTYVTGLDSHNAFKITFLPNGSVDTITEIIDCTGDGAGNGLDRPIGIAVDAAGSAFVTGLFSDNAFKITFLPNGSVDTITEIIDAAGDGEGNGLDESEGITVDAFGNAYVTGFTSDNAFKITPAGVITEIIDTTGDGAGNGLNGARAIAVDAAGNAYVSGRDSDNAFKITPAGVITEIIDATGDGSGNVLDQTQGIAVDAAGNVYVTGRSSDNAFKITFLPNGSVDTITEIIDAAGDGANGLDNPRGIAVDAAGNAYVTGFITNNAFKITLDLDDDGVAIEIDVCPNTPAGLPVACDGRPLRDCNGDCLVNGDDIQCIVDEMLNQ